MPIVTFHPIDRTIEVPPGAVLLDAIHQAGIRLEASCGGDGQCGKCVVQIETGKVESCHSEVLPASQEVQGFVLACKARILEDSVTVKIPEQAARSAGQFIDETDIIAINPRDLFPDDCISDAPVTKHLLDVTQPRLQDGLSDLDRLTRAIQTRCGKKRVAVPLPVMRQVADALRAGDGRVSVTMQEESDRFQIIALETGDRASRQFGIAIDIGTTTIAVQLVDLKGRRTLAVRSAYNDQIDCGLDVISRINYARRPERLEELRAKVVATLNRLVRAVCHACGVDPCEVTSAAAAGNTTMIHLLLGLNPEYIRLDPYTPTIMQSLSLTAREIGIIISPEALVYLSPAVGSYVGGDITAGMLCTRLAPESEKVNLFIDIGTNGELVVGNQEFLLTCACSAGPAFEGGGIECGMRAARGAIDTVTIDPDSGVASYRTIGDCRPAGLCGSGMISLLADLFLTGWIDPAGKINRERESAAVRIDGRQARYVIVPAGETASGKPITISESDIDNIIRAKAAVYAACSLTLEQVGLDFTHLDNIFIAGGFGRFLDIEKAVIIGLIPDLPEEKYHYLGNASLLGACKVLVSLRSRQYQAELCRRMTYLELNTDPAYMAQYTGALFLPHTDAHRFPSVEKLMCQKRRR